MYVIDMLVISSHNKYAIVVTENKLTTQIYFFDA